MSAPMPLTLCHTCGTVFAHAGQAATAASTDHALDVHRDTLVRDAGSLSFSHLAESPRTLCPDLPEGAPQ